MSESLQNEFSTTQEPYILDHPSQATPTQVSIEKQPLKDQTEQGGPTQDKICDPEHEDISAEHELDHLRCAKWSSIGSEVIGSNLDHHESHSQPEESEKAMKLRVGKGRVQSIKSTPLSRELEVSKQKGALWRSVGFLQE